MYLSEDKIEKNALRQGDIIFDTQILGAINLNGISYQINQKGEKIAWSVQQAPVFGPSIILSHSCEIDASNGIKLTSIILAPLRDLNNATNNDKVQELIDSNIITESSTHSYLKYFYLPHHNLLPFTDGCIVDFSKCYSLRKQSFDTLLKNKRLQLNTEYSDKMALKFSVYFYRCRNSTVAC